MKPIEECKHKEKDRDGYVDDTLYVFYCSDCGLPTGHLPIVLGESEVNEDDD